MDGWQVGLEYVKALVWPGVAVFFGWRFKTQAGRLLDRLISLKTPAGTAEFDRQARDVVIEAQAAEAKQVVGSDNEGKVASKAPSHIAQNGAAEEVDSSDGSNAREGRSVLPAEILRALTADDFEIYRNVAAIDPAASVMGAWRRVEQFMHLALRAGQINQRWSNAMVLRGQLQELGLGSHFVRVADELRRLRNSVAHRSRDVNISAAGALDYVDAAERLSDALVMLQARGLNLGRKNVR
jgi:hypothetical protein